VGSTVNLATMFRSILCSLSLPFLVLALSVNGSHLSWNYGNDVHVVNAEQNREEYMADVNTASFSATTEPIIKLTIGEALEEATAVLPLFESAAARWSEIVTNDLIPSAPLFNFNVINQCSDGSLGLPSQSGFIINAGTILTQLNVFAEITTIDGENGILGSASPCNLEGGFGTRFNVCLMVFDVDDLNLLLENGAAEDVILHEMGHCLGIGVSWSPLGLLNGAGESNPEYTGANGKDGYEKLGESGNVPVENVGGAGTRDAHWRDSVFGTELMTGLIGAGKQPLSILTIKSLQDLGFTVDESLADDYEIPSGLTRDQIIIISTVTIIVVMFAGTWLYLRRINRKSREKLAELQDHFEERKRRRREAQRRLRMPSKAAIARTLKRTRSKFSSKGSRKDSRSNSRNPSGTLYVTGPPPPIPVKPDSLRFNV